MPVRPNTGHKKTTKNDFLKLSEYLIESGKKIVKISKHQFESVVYGVTSVS